MKFISVYHPFHDLLLFLLSRNKNHEAFGPNCKHFETSIVQRLRSRRPSMASCNNQCEDDFGMKFSVYLTSEQEIIVPTKLIEQAIVWINSYCDRQFLYAVVASDYHFLYRGIKGTTAELYAPQPSIQNDAPDLLKLETYGSNEAVQFFYVLEDFLRSRGSKLRPSTGHLATTSFQDASKWGTYAASIWPMSSPDLSMKKLDSAFILLTQRNDDTNYAWFRDHGLFYSRSSEVQISAQKDERRSSRKTLQDYLRRSIIIDGQNFEESDCLTDALQFKACEILFPARPFLAIPALFDEVLRHKLKSSFLI
jgi:hypothetical protein